MFEPLSVRPTETAVLPEPTTRLVSNEEGAKLADVSMATWFRAIAPKLTKYRPSRGTVRFRLADVQAFLERSADDATE